MESSRNTKALVLSRQDYRENDSLAVFYSLNYGKLALIARGAKKAGSKLAGHIEPLSLVDLMVISGKGRDYVGGVIAREQYHNLKKDLNALYYAGLGVSWLRRLTEEGEAEPELFYLLSSYLELLDSRRSEVLLKEEGDLLFAFFAFQLAAVIGYQPQVISCLECRQPAKSGKNYFDLKSGGLVCAACFAGKQRLNQEFLTISDNCVKLLRLILDNKLEVSKKIKIDKKSAKEIASLAKDFLNFRS